MDTSKVWAWTKFATAPITASAVITGIVYVVCRWGGLR